MITWTLVHYRFKPFVFFFFGFCFNLHFCRVRTLRILFWNHFSFRHADGDDFRAVCCLGHISQRSGKCKLVNWEPKTLRTFCNNRDFCIPVCLSLNSRDRVIYKRKGSIKAKIENRWNLFLNGARRKFLRYCQKYNTILNENFFEVHFPRCNAFLSN